MKLSLNNFTLEGSFNLAVCLGYLTEDYFSGYELSRGEEKIFPIDSTMIKEFKLRPDDLTKSYFGDFHGANCLLFRPRFDLVLPEELNNEQLQLASQVIITHGMATEVCFLQSAIISRELAENLLHQWFPASGIFGWRNRKSQQQIERTLGDYQHFLRTEARQVIPLEAAIACLGESSNYRLVSLPHST